MTLNHKKTRPKPIPWISNQEIQRVRAKVLHPSTVTNPTITLRHEWTLELKEVTVSSALAPAFLFFNWHLCGDYKLDLRKNRMYSTYAGKRGKTRGAQRWRALDYSAALAMFNQLMKLEGPSQLRLEEPK